VRRTTPYDTVFDVKAAKHGAVQWTLWPWRCKTMKNNACLWNVYYNARSLQSLKSWKSCWRSMRPNATAYWNLIWIKWIKRKYCIGPTTVCLCLQRVQCYIEGSFTRDPAPYGAAWCRTASEIWRVSGVAPYTVPYVPDPVWMNRNRMFNRLSC